MVYIIKTTSKREVDTVEIFPTSVNMPLKSLKYLATIATKQLTIALVNLQPAIPFYQVIPEQMAALK
jgi:hypothetical protein